MRASVGKRLLEREGIIRFKWRRARIKGNTAEVLRLEMRSVADIYKGGRPTWKELDGAVFMRRLTQKERQALELAFYQRNQARLLHEIGNSTDFLKTVSENL